MYKSIWKSEDGRFETFENEAGKTFMIKRVLTFHQWIEKTFNRYDKFIALKDSDKEKILMRYKYGLSDDNANYNLEHTRRYIMKNLILPKDLAEGGYYNSIKAFEDYCYEIKKEIGLIPSEEDTKIISSAREIFTSKSEHGCPADKDKEIPF